MIEINKVATGRKALACFILTMIEARVIAKQSKYSGWQFIESVIRQFQ